MAFSPSGGPFLSHLQSHFCHSTLCFSLTWNLSLTTARLVMDDSWTMLMRGWQTSIPHKTTFSWTFDILGSPTPTKAFIIGVLWWKGAMVGGLSSHFSFRESYHCWVFISSFVFSANSFKPLLWEELLWQANKILELLVATHLKLEIPLT